MVFLSGFKNYQKFLIPLIVIIICIYAFYLRLESRSISNLWLDELTQLRIIDKPFGKFIQALRGHQYCGYIAGDYYLTYPFARIFHDNKWGLAIPHMISTILGFWLLYLVAKRYFKTIWGYLITFTVVCFNPTLIQHALEIRRYAVLPTLALGCFYLAFKLVDQNRKMNIKKKWAIGLFFILTIWFDVFGIVMLSLPIFFVLLVKKTDPDFKAAMIHTINFLAVILLVAVPFLLYNIFIPSSEYDVLKVFKYISNPAVNIVGFLKNIFANLIGYRYKYFYPLLISLFFPFFLPYKERFQQVAFLLIMVFIPVGLILVIDILAKYWFIQRQFIWVMPFFALFLGWSWDSTIHYLGGKMRRSKNA